MLNVRRRSSAPEANGIIVAAEAAAAEEQNKFIPPHHIQYHTNVGISMSSIMTDITTDEILASSSNNTNNSNKQLSHAMGKFFQLGGGNSESALGLEKAAAVDLQSNSQEEMYFADYDNTSFIGYLEEIEKNDQAEKERQLQRRKEEENEIRHELDDFDDDDDEEAEVKDAFNTSRALQERQRQHTKADPKMSLSTVKTATDDPLLINKAKNSSCSFQEYKEEINQKHEDDDEDAVVENANDLGLFLQKRVSHFFGRKNNNKPAFSPQGPVVHNTSNVVEPEPSYSKQIIATPAIAAYVEENKAHDDQTCTYTRMLEEEVIRLKLELAYAQTQSDQHKLSYSKLSEEREQLKQSNSNLIAVNKDLSDINAKHMVRLSRLQQIKDVIIQRHEKISQDLMSNKTELQAATNELDTLRKRTKEQDAVISYLKQNIEKTTKEKNDLKLENEQLQQQDFALTNDCHTSISMPNIQRPSVQRMLSFSSNPRSSLHASMGDIINEEMNASNNGTSSLVKPLHLLQMEQNDLIIKNQFLQEENKQLKNLILEQEQIEENNNFAQASKSKNNSCDHDIVRDSSAYIIQSTSTPSDKNHQSYRTVISNTLQEEQALQFSIQKQQQEQIFTTFNSMHSSCVDPNSCHVPLD